MSSQFDESTFVPASDALQEILSNFDTTHGSGSKTHTEPLLIWLDLWAGGIIETTMSSKSNYFGIREVMYIYY